MPKIVPVQFGFDLIKVFFLIDLVIDNEIISHSTVLFYKITSCSTYKEMTVDHADEFLTLSKPCTICWKPKSVSLADSAA